MGDSFRNGVVRPQWDEPIDKKEYQQMVWFLYIALRSQTNILSVAIIFARFRKPAATYCHQEARRVVL